MTIAATDVTKLKQMTAPAFKPYSLLLDLKIPCFLVFPHAERAIFIELGSGFGFFLFHFVLYCLYVNIFEVINDNKVFLLFFQK